MHRGECFPRGPAGVWEGLAVAEVGAPGKTCTEVELDGVETALFRDVSRLHEMWHSDCLTFVVF